MAILSKAAATLIQRTAANPFKPHLSPVFQLFQPVNSRCLSTLSPNIKSNLHRINDTRIIGVNGVSGVIGVNGVNVVGTGINGRFFSTEAPATPSTTSPSTTAPPTTETPTNPNPNPPGATPTTPTTPTFAPPDKLSSEAIMAAQQAMKFVIEHGLGKRKLEECAEAKKKGEPIINRWQTMMQTYLETQCQILSLMGYQPNEHGIALYTQHLQKCMQTSSPEIQEALRQSSRDIYRMTLQSAFDLPLMEDQKLKGELSIVDARNIMHKVSLKMQQPETLEKIAKSCSVSVAVGDSPEAKAIDLARKHTVIQQVMVSDVYLGGSPSLVQECGFGEGEDGYVRMQSAMAEHQQDPLISQYVGSAMVKLMQSAGIDIPGMQGQQ